MAAMDLWYDLAIREPGALNDEVDRLLREAQDAAGPPEPEETDEGAQ